MLDACIHACSNAATTSTKSFYRSVGCDDSMASYPQCLHYQAAYRVAFVTTVFFVMTTIVSAVEPSWYTSNFSAFLSHAFSVVGLQHQMYSSCYLLSSKHCAPRVE